MKKTTFLSAICALMFVFTNTNISAQSVFVLQNGNRTLFYNNMSNVMSNLQNGDTLYLPPKPIDGNFVFDKKITIIGAGYHPDTAAVTGITKITGYVEFNLGTKGSSMTGVRTEGNIYLHDSILSVTRCDMTHLIIQNGSSPISQIYVGDCVIRGYIDGCNNVVTNALIERCLIHGNINGGNKTNNLMIKNCILLSNGDYWYMNGVSGLIIQNSIILSSAYNFGDGFMNNTSSNTFKNNLFVRGEFSPSSFVMSGNIFGITRDNIFVDESKSDYHLKPLLTQAFTLATDGKQVGIYGTSYPFLVPTYAPRFISINNAENVVDGKLSVKMKVEARER